MANIFTSTLTNNVGTTPSTVYTANTTDLTSATVIGMTVANQTGLDITASVQVVRTGGVTVFLTKDISIPAGTTLIPIGGEVKIVLLDTDSITVETSAASSADVTVSVLEITTT